MIPQLQSKAVENSQFILLKPIYDLTRKGRQFIK